MRRRLLPLILLLLLLGCQRAAIRQASVVYVHGRAEPGTLVHIYYPTGSETDAKTGPSGYWGQTVTRQNGTFELVVSDGCIVAGPSAASVRDCKATFKLPQGDTYGDFVVEAVSTPTPTATATPTPEPTTTATTGAGSTLIICNRVLHLEAVTVDGRLTVAMVCAEGEVQ